MRALYCCGLGLMLLVQPVWAEEPAGAAGSGTAKAGTARSGGSEGTAAPRPARSSAPAVAAEGAAPGEKRETVALEIVVKAPKPIPPVELDMLQLRLMLTDLKASFVDEIDRALFREPF
jgi:hypothetical protein